MYSDTRFDVILIGFYVALKYISLMRLTTYIGWEETRQCPRHSHGYLRVAHKLTATAIVRDPLVTVKDVSFFHRQEPIRKVQTHPRNIRKKPFSWQIFRTDSKALICPKWISWIHDPHDASFIPKATPIGHKFATGKIYHWLKLQLIAFFHLKLSCKSSLFS